MCPVVVARGGTPYLALGASGGRKIVAAVLQLASFVIDFGMDLEAAAHAPRLDASGADLTTLDRRLDAVVVDAVGALGPVERVEHTIAPGQFANPNMVSRDEAGFNVGVADAMSPWSAAVAEPEPEPGR